MLMFQGNKFNNKEELYEYINSQTTDVTTSTEQLIKKLQEYFNYKIIDIIKRNEDDYIIYFQTEDNTTIEHSFSNNEDIEDIRLRLQKKINAINQIILAVKNMGIEEIKCVNVWEETKKEVGYTFQFKLHKEDSGFTEAICIPNNNINDFIKSFRQYTSNKLEGKFKILDCYGNEVDNWDSNYIDIPLKIDGIEINGFLERALKQHKHIRLEIVE